MTSPFEKTDFLDKDIEPAFKRRGLSRALQAGFVFGFFIWLGYLAACWWMGA